MKHLIQQVGSLLYKNRLIISLIFVFILLRFPQLLSQEQATDEGIYAAIAYGLAHGKTLYVTIWDHKPPLIFLIYVLAGIITDFQAIPVITALFSITAGIMSILLFNKTLKLIFLDEKRMSVTLLVVFTFLLGFPFYANYQVNAEVFGIPIILLIINMLFEKKSPIIVGFLIFLAFLLKMQFFVEAIGIFLAYLAITAVEKRAVAPTIFRLSLGFLIPFLVTLAYLYSQGLLPTVYDSLIVKNATYVAIISPVLLGTAISVRTLLYITTAVGLLFSLLLLLAKKLTSWSYFIVTLFILEAFAVFFGLRAYPHYMIQLIPGMTLLIGYALTRQSQKERLSVLLLITITHIIFFTDALFIHQENSHYSITNHINRTLSNNHHTELLRFREIASRHCPNGLIFLVTDRPWHFLYLPQQESNTYIFSRHLTFFPEALSQSLTEAANSACIIVENRASAARWFSPNTLISAKQIARTSEYSIYRPNAVYTEQ